MRKLIKDHLGNEFKSVSAMCDYWGIPNSTYKQRMGTGRCTMEQALTYTSDKYRKLITNTYRKVAIDHLGNHYINIAEMCRHWNIAKNVYKYRKLKGWSTEKALTEPVSCVVDHLGKEYSSIVEMCQAYNISRTTFIERMKTGRYTVEQALTVPLRGQHLIKPTWETE